MDRDKMTKISNAPLLISLLNVINYLAIAEKSYLALTFLEQKWFVRRESGKGIYTQASSELQKIEQRSKPHLLQAPRQDGLEYLVSHIAEQLAQFVKARQEMMDFYMKLCNPKVETDYSEMSTILDTICERYKNSFHHPLLAPLKNSWTLETDIILSLLQARTAMSHWHFLPSLLRLHDAHTKLEVWGSPFKAKEPKKKLSAYVSVKNNVIPSLMCWLMRFYLALISKFSFYFHETLSKQSPPADIKSHLSNLSMDYTAILRTFPYLDSLPLSRVVTFQKKTDANYIILVFDTHGSQYTGHGYHFPVGFTEPPTGLDSFPAVFSYPRDKPIHLWPNVVMLLSESSGGNVERPTYCYDMQQQITYFIIKVDIKMSLLLVFEAKKSEKDTNISNFLQDMASCLRGTRLLSNLRQGSKN
ncbi:putative UPF0536 protein C12orf66-like [Apostichopus japonicus]|uniref:Putative UPF0536 protein C12orf66-like n=1 Tax=Stichopus japonicus TaxID=307972 RepID=A0A2G8K554_STIJA|nr:putative UPF0536 protein C12orf66-like [Apostichopus japonicus]